MFVPYQERVIEEKKQLDEKIKVLGDFFKIDLFQNLAADEKDRLRRQHALMIGYSDVLGERIAAF